MIEKIILGVFIGFLTGACANALYFAKNNASYRPLNMGWLETSAALMSIIYISFIVMTFVTYGFKFGLFAIGEIFLGTLIAGLVSRDGRLAIGMCSVPAAAIAGIFLW